MFIQINTCYKYDFMNKCFKIIQIDLVVTDLSICGNNSKIIYNVSSSFNTDRKTTTPSSSLLLIHS